MKKILIFGSGSCCDRIFEMNTQFRKDTFEIEYIVDNSASKWGMSYNGYKITSPEIIKKAMYDYIVIASSYFNEIKQQLIDDFGVDEGKIIGRDTIYRWYCNYVYELTDNKKNKKIDCSKEKIVVYTAIFGGKDNIKTPKVVDQDFDYICFTDNKLLKSDVWKIIYVDSEESKDPCRLAKIYKILPHRYFENYTISIWIDGSATIVGDLKKYISAYFNETNLLCCPHMWYDCIYDEFYVCEKERLDDADILFNQQKKYKEENYPPHNGLISGGFIVRRHNDKTVAFVMEKWWQEICNYSRRDQLSFNYVMWKYNVKYAISPIYIFDNEYIKIKEHLH